MDTTQAVRKLVEVEYQGWQAQSIDGYLQAMATRRE